MNWFTDEDGYVVYDLYERVPPFIIELYRNAYAKHRKPIFIYELTPDVLVEIWEEEYAYDYYGGLNAEVYPYDVR